MDFDDSRNLLPNLKYKGRFTGSSIWLVDFNIHIFCWKILNIVGSVNRNYNVSPFCLWTWRGAAGLPFNFTLCSFLSRTAPSSCPDRRTTPREYKQDKSGMYIRARPSSNQMEIKLVSFKRELCSHSDQSPHCHKSRPKTQRLPSGRKRKLTLTGTGRHAV